MAKHPKMYYSQLHIFMFPLQLFLRVGINVFSMSRIDSDDEWARLAQEESVGIDNGPWAIAAEAEAVHEDSSGGEWVEFADREANSNRSAATHHSCVGVQPPSSVEAGTDHEHCALASDDVGDELPHVISRPLCVEGTRRRRERFT